MSKNFYLSWLLTAIFSVTTLYASKVDTVKVFSPSMKKEIKAVIITPTSCSADTPSPVLYLLHGYSGDYSSWVKAFPVISELADKHDMMIVCPDGAYGSWYMDSPVDPDFKYETFVAEELISWIDKNYNTVASREGRAITGLSMGGHGGLYLAFRNQDQFGACGSMSGGVDIRPFPDNWDIAKRLGTQQEFPERWEHNTVMGLLHLLTPNKLSIIIDCGTEDFFYEVNERLHRELLYRNIPHDYISRPGIHDWNYWANAIKYQVLFFSEFFKISN